MKTQYYAASSLDGFIATNDHSLDWLFPLADINQSSYPEFIQHIGAIAMGASTYEWMVCNSEYVIAEIGSAWPYTQPVWVFPRKVFSPALILTSVQQMGEGMVELRYDVKSL